MHRRRLMIYSCGRSSIDGCLVVFAARLTHGSGELEHVRVGFVTTRRAQVPALPQRDGPLSHGRRLESLVVEVLESYDAFDRSAVQNEPSPVPFLQKKNVRWSKLLQRDMFSDNAWRRTTDLDESLNGKLVEVAFFPYRDEGHLSVAGRKTDGAAPPLFAKRVSAYANLERNFRKTTTAEEVQLNLFCMRRSQDVSVAYKLGCSGITACLLSSLARWVHR